MFLLPFRNVIDRLHAFPLGNDIVDIMIFALVIGTMVRKLTSKNETYARSPVIPIAIILIFYMFISVIHGSMYLNEYSIFSLVDPRVQKWKNFCD